LSENTCFLKIALVQTSAMKFIFAGCCIFLSLLVCAQKKPISFDSMHKWEWFSERRISNDGNWIAFGTTPDESRIPLLRIVDRRRKITHEYPNAGRCIFTADSRKVFFYAGIADPQPDTVVLVDLHNYSTKQFPGARQLQLAKDNGDVFGLKTGEAGGDTLHVFYQNDKKPVSLTDVIQYWLHPSGSHVFASVKTPKDILLLSIDLANQKIDTVLRELEMLPSLAFDDNGKKVACVIKKDGEMGIVEISYRPNDLSVNKISLPFKSREYVMTQRSSVKYLGSRYLLFSTNYDHRRGMQSLPSSAAKVEVWSYTDDRIYPLQKKQLVQDLNKEYFFVYDLELNQLLQLTDLEIDQMEFPSEASPQYVLLSTAVPYRAQRQWDPVPRNDAYVLDLPSGKRIPIARNKAARFGLSPAGKYVYWFDREAAAYFSYSIKDNATKLISKGVTDAMADKREQLPQVPDAYGAGIWQKDDEALLITTEYDVWEIDPSAKKPAVNLTSGYGRKNNINLSWYGARNGNSLFFATEDTLLFYGTNLNNKQAGFFAITANAKAEPIKLIYGDYYFTYPGMENAGKSNDLLLSFGNSQSYGLYHSSDLKNFELIHSLNKHREEYNWYSTELVKWKNKQGKTMEGMLYKPEDFDPTKKYPLLIWVYDKDNAAKVNAYTMPKWSASIVDFALYASNGYLVFLPDMDYKMGEPGESALTTVLSGIAALGKQPWVDTSRIGIQGHSWGGYQVAYMVTKTSVFKAASVGAPVADMISAYGNLRADIGESRQWIYEKHQSRLGKTLWEDRDAYLRNSPLFGVPRIKTSLLIMHNEGDGMVPFSQSIELFTAMKRNGKKVWLLNYAQENHVIMNMNNRKDFSKRMFQFFEHYLKGQAAPEWMIKGLPAVKEGWSAGY
jgi:dipeptidyl aminopeptidase/acylaminoacyl peptidase